MASDQAKAIFSSALARATGMSPAIAVAWTRIENGPDDNPLGIGGASNLAHYGNPVLAAQASALKMTTLGISTIGTDTQVINSIAFSPWFEGYRTRVADKAKWDADHVRYRDALISAYDRAYRDLYGKGPSLGGFVHSETPKFLGGGGEAVPNLAAGASDIGGTIDGWLKFLQTAAFLIDPHNWLRAVEFITGMGLLLLGVLFLARTSMSAGSILEQIRPGRGDAEDPVAGAFARGEEEGLRAAAKQEGRRQGKARGGASYRRERGLDDDAQMDKLSRAGF